MKTLKDSPVKMTLLSDDEIIDISPRTSVCTARAIEAAVLAKLREQEPVLRVRKGKIDGSDCDGIEFAEQEESCKWNWLSIADGEHDLYAHPLPTSDVIRDAERYRWLRDKSNWLYDDKLDATIDAAMREPK